ncbi:hypothetical protein [Massilia sp. CCM 8734]|uniref:hypothetical protein n=1 Tax=Massilia sp. CCM 8734 TaxID=2609283 RepID=UPI001AAEDD5A|nr:hypothetical protein [Massilia sp. CCM 8734]
MTTISYVKSNKSLVAKGAAALGAGTPYSLTLVNESGTPFTFYVYQQMPNQASENVFSLAWFCSPYNIGQGNQITFQWDIEYGFVWGSSGIIQPGVTFNAGGDIPANPQSNNCTTFSNSQTLGPNLSAAQAGQPQGSLVISDASNVASNQFSVGVSMSGAGTFVTNAGPNLTHTFTPTPTYWIAAGSNVHVGTVMDITTVNQNAQVIFPPNVYALTYTLNASNQWVSP